MEDELLTTSLASHLAVALQNLQRFQEERKVTEYLQRAMLPEIPRVRGLSLDLCYESATKSRLVGGDFYDVLLLSLIHISEPTRRTPISYAVFCLKKKKTQQTKP